MSHERTYAAVHLGDRTVSVLLSVGATVTERCYETAVSFRAGSPVYLADADGAVPAVAAPNVPIRMADSAASVERNPWAFVDDPEMLVGSTVVPVDVVFGGTIAAALLASGAGAGGTVDLLEIACPSSWGQARQDVMQKAAKSSAREVLVVDAATAAAQSIGERAPSFAMVVEIGDTSSIVCSLTRTSAGGGSSTQAYGRTGHWDEVGVRDIAADVDAEAVHDEAVHDEAVHDEAVHDEASGRRAAPGRRRRESAASKSLRERVTASAARHGGRDLVDVFVLNTASAPVSADFLAGVGMYRMHHLRGADVVRSMAARMGVSTLPSESGREPVSNRVVSNRGVESSRGSGPVNGSTASESADLPIALYQDVSRQDMPASQAPLQGAAPSPLRAGAWLDEVHPVLAPARSKMPLVLGVMGALALVAALVVAVSGSPTPVAIPVGSATVPHPSIPSPSNTVQQSSAAAATTVVTPVPDSGFVRFAYGRASIELPIGWTPRAEDTRLVLIPPDFPDRRIVLTTIELVPGATLDGVADDLTAQLAARGEQSRIGNLSRATDFGERVGISYEESPGDESVVRWRVFVDGDLQVNIGCQSSIGTEEALEADCERAAATLEVTRPR
ncbi:type VII secretion-associated protein [Rhodococcus sp. G-MC3]|uniref:type VII secretion-associated protein n=1 Tax=Rhodococcus sp. G-MC3 TaxID=3046209 RepID=UPI0024B8E98C|nr:type VII secretion-associated protein [Rhodococcus sp. G-MC3]MDJ0392728.1 type VII secretion-associated protein [Rhodococcus sp. G-MC3]